MPLGGSCERGQVSAHWEIPSLAGRSAGTKGEFWSLGGECSNWFAEGKAERDLHRRSVLPGTPQPEMIVCWGRRGLGAEAQVSEDGPWGEDCGWLHGDSLQGLGCGGPRPREYGKKPGPAREASLHCWGAREARGSPTIGVSFSAHAVRWQGTTYTSSRDEHKPPLPSWTPEVGMDCYHCRASCKRALVTAPTFLGTVRPATKGAATRHQPLPPPPRECAWSRHLHTPYQGDNSQHTLRKKTASIQTKTSSHAKKILNPHKLCRDAPAYK